MLCPGLVMWVEAFFALQAFVVVGDSNGHVGLGVKCAKEVRCCCQLGLQQAQAKQSAHACKLRKVVHLATALWLHSHHNIKVVQNIYSLTAANCSSAQLHGSHYACLVRVWFAGVQQLRQSFASLAGCHCYPWCYHPRKDGCYSCTSWVLG